MAAGSEAGVKSGGRRRGEVLGGPGEPCASLLFKSCSLLWRLLAFLVPLPWFSSVTEGLMTATQSGATACSRSSSRRGGGRVMKWPECLLPAPPAPAGGWKARCGLGLPVVRTLRILADAE